MIDDIIVIGGGDELPEYKKQPTSLQDFIDLFLSEHNVSKSSTERYKKSLRVFKLWVEKHGITLIGKAELKRYSDYLKEESSNFSNLTVNAYMTAVRIFYTWLYDEDYIPKNIAKNLENVETVKTHQRKALTEEECASLLNYYKGRGRTRDYAMVNLMLRIGLRTIEVSRMKVGDIGQNGKNRVIWIHGKGRVGKDDFNLLEEPAFIPLRDYIAFRGHVDPNDPMFVSEASNGKGNRIDSKTVSSIVREGLNAIGLTGAEYTAHSLRNTCGSLLIKAGISLPRVQQVMRHKNMATTQGYVHDAEEKKRMEENPESALNNLF